MGLIRLGDHQETARVLIEAVDDAGPPHSADAGETRPAMGDERIDQGSGFMSGGRMHHKTSGFVDHDEVLVLIDDRQRDGLGLGLGRSGGRQFRLDLFACLHPAPRLPYLAALDSHAAIGNNILETRAAHLWKAAA